LLVAALALSSVAHAQSLDKLPEGAPIYASLRPLAAIGLLKRLGAGDLPEVKQLSQSLGGMDVLNPGLLMPTGIDVAAPIVGMVEVLPKRLGHARVIAPLRDPALFESFLGAVAASKQVGELVATAPDSPMGKLGIKAFMNAPNHALLIVRVVGSSAYLDYIEPGAPTTRTMTGAEMVKKLPTTVTKPFVAEKGARALFSPDAAFVIYADGHKLPSLVQQLDDKPIGKADEKCLKDWTGAPGAFDDVALSVGVDPDGLSASLAWGSRSAVPLGGLKLKPIDDGAFDVSVLKSAPAVLALYAATLSPFTSLKRSGPLASSTALTDGANKCGTAAMLTLFTRSWPQAIGALLSDGGKSGNPMQAQILAAFGSLRTVVLVMRDLTHTSARWAVGATLDPEAKSILEIFLGASSGGSAPAPLKVGKRSPMVYHLNLDGTAASAGVETLTGGMVSALIADSDESISWSLRTATLMPGKTAAPAEPTPILAAYLDGPAVIKMLPELRLSRSDEAALAQGLARLRRIDARLTAEGDLFRLTVRAPVKQ
jgi:hypothetical protein